MVAGNDYPACVDFLNLDLNGLPCPFASQVSACPCICRHYVLAIGCHSTSSPSPLPPSHFLPPPSLSPSHFLPCPYSLSPLSSSLPLQMAYAAAVTASNVRQSEYIWRPVLAAGCVPGLVTLIFSRFLLSGEHRINV